MTSILIRKEIRTKTRRKKQTKQLYWDIARRQPSASREEKPQKRETWQQLDVGFPASKTMGE